MVVTNHLFVLVTTLWFPLHSHVQHLKQPPVCIDLKMLVSWQPDKVYCTVTFAACDDLQSGEEHVNLNVAALSKSPHVLWAALLLLLHKSGCVSFYMLQMIFTQLASQTSCDLTYE